MQLNLDPGRYSLWVHLTMASLVGGTMIAVGLFIAWRIEHTHETLDHVEAHLLRQDDATAQILKLQRQTLARLPKKLK